jgi:NAD(P)-dependent dehydrogenase (short-subunit alcohol dehydrogenase family)
VGRLQDKVAIVTGASAGIGRATAKLFAAEGRSWSSVPARSRTGKLGRRNRGRRRECSRIGGGRPLRGLRKALVALAVEKFGRLDIAFNNAGTLGEAGPSTAVSEAGWNDDAAAATAAALECAPGIYNVVDDDPRSARQRHRGLRKKKLSGRLDQIPSTMRPGFAAHRTRRQNVS